MATEERADFEIEKRQKRGKKDSLFSRGPFCSVTLHVDGAKVPRRGAGVRVPSPGRPESSHFLIPPMSFLKSVVCRLLGRRGKEVT